MPGTARCLKMFEDYWDQRFAAGSNETPGFHESGWRRRPQRHDCQRPSCHARLNCFPGREPAKVLRIGRNGNIDERRRVRQADDGVLFPGLGICRSPAIVAKNVTRSTANLIQSQMPQKIHFFVLERPIATNSGSSRIVDALGTINIIVGSESEEKWQGKKQAQMGLSKR